MYFFFVKQKTAYEMRISDWSSDVCSSDLKLLKSMTDEVAGLVLTDNYRQNQALSLMERMSVSRLGSKQHFIQTLESQGLIDRQIEDLPSDSEIAERKARTLGLTPPELSIQLSHTRSEEHTSEIQSLKSISKALHS